MTLKKIAREAKVRDKYLQKKYGITLEIYDQKLAEQNDCCALCGKHKSSFKRSLHVDHNHKTKKVRGLVCYYCNNKLIFKHTRDTATKLKDYMDTYDS